MKGDSCITLEGSSSASGALRTSRRGFMKLAALSGMGVCIKSAPAAGVGAGAQSGKCGLAAAAKESRTLGSASAALFDKIGSAIFVTHSQGGAVGWRTLLKTKNIKAIVSYEPGGSIPFPKGQMPPEAKILTLSKKTEGVEVPMSAFMEYAKVPIIVFFGDNLPDSDGRPEQYEWTRRLRLMRIWAKMLNDLGGDVTVVHLPEAGLRGNTHFPMSDLNNIEVANLMSDWLREKNLE